MDENRQKHIEKLLAQGGKLQAIENLQSLYGDFSYTEYSILLNGVRWRLTYAEWAELKAKGIE